MRSIPVAIACLAVGLAAAAGPVPVEKGHEGASRVEPIEGSSLKKVVLTERAAQRLGIETAPVKTETVELKRTIEGAVMAVPYSDKLLELMADDGLTSSALVQARPNLYISPDKISPGARARPVGGIGKIRNLTAHLLPAAEAARPERQADMIFVMDSVEGELTSPQSVFLDIATTEEARKTMPTDALFYDEHGGTWAFTNPEPLTYVRHPVEVEFVQSEMVVLVDGPPDGTLVVTRGAMLLFGTELGVGH